MSNFNEATRVQMPAMVHLTRLGYSYFGKINEDMAGTVYDPDTNILTEVFRKQFFSMEKEVDGKIESTDQKHIMRYQQLFASLAIRQQLLEGATSGVVWHTQGECMIIKLR